MEPILRHTQDLFSENSESDLHSKSYRDSSNNDSFHVIENGNSGQNRKCFQGLFESPWSICYKSSARCWNSCRKFPVYNPRQMVLIQYGTYCKIQNQAQVRFRTVLSLLACFRNNPDLRPGCGIYQLQQPALVSFSYPC